VKKLISRFCKKCKYQTHHEFNRKTGEYECCQCNIGTSSEKKSEPARAVRL
jgi:hypothetical protein